MYPRSFSPALRSLVAFTLLTATWCAAPFASAQQPPFLVPQTINRVAGTGLAGAAGNGGPATQATLNGDQGVAVDQMGNLFIADSGNNVVRKVDAFTGNIGVYAGGAAAICAVATDGTGNNCPATEAKLNRPTQLTITAGGDLLISDYGDNQIRVVNHETQTITAYAGYYGGYGGDGGPANRGLLYAPGQTAVDASGNLYIADTNNQLIRVVANPNGPASVTIAGVTVAAGDIATIAGTHGVTGATGDGAAATAATLDYPTGIAVDSFGNIYIADSYNLKIRVIYVQGTVPGLSSMTAGDIYTFAGGGTNYNSGALALQAQFGKPVALQIDAHNNVFVVDYNYQRIARIAADTSIVTFAAGGSSNCGGAIDAFGDGCPAVNVGLKLPQGIAFDSLGNLFIAESGNNLVRKVTTGADFGSVQPSSPASHILVAHYVPGDQPSSGNPFTINGTSTDFKLTGGPGCGGGAVPGYDCQFTVQFTPTAPGQRSTSAILNSYHSKAEITLSGKGMAPAVSIDPGTASLLTSSLAGPSGAATDYSGNLYIADSGHNQVLLYAPLTQKLSVFAGTGTAGYSGDGASATLAELSAPQAVAVDPQGNVFIADTGNNVVREVVALTGTIETIAGSGQAGFAGDGGTAAAAKFDAPAGLAIDGMGNVFIADTANNRIREIVGGYVSTVAGGASSVCNSSSDGAGDGCPGTESTLSAPAGLALDGQGNLFIADSGHQTVRRLNLSSSTIGLVAGTGTAGFSGDGGQATQAELNGPKAVALDAAGNIFISDSVNNLVRKIDGSGTITTVVGGGTSPSVPTAANTLQISGPTAIALDPAANLYIADSGNSRALEINRSQVALVLGSANAGQTSAPETVTLSNNGTAGLTLNSPLFAATGDTAAFALQPAAGGAGCNPGATLNPAASCNLAATFSPSAAGPAQESVSFSTNGIGSPATLALSGTGTNLATTTIALAAPSTTNNSSGYLQPLAIVAVVAPAAGASGTPTGQLTFVVDGVSQPQVQLVGGSATLNLNALAIGQHTINAAYSGDASFAANPGGTPLVITITPDAVTEVLTASTASASLNQNVTFTATVASAVGAPAGTVTFNNGTTPLGTVALNGNGVATFSTSTLALGTYSITAVYSGDAQFVGTTSNAVSLTVGLVPTLLNVDSFASGAFGVTVAADGTGNYTTVQAAVNSLASTGGTIYIKPGTYTEVVHVSQNNVQLRGLGTDPSQVVITYNNASSTSNGAGGTLGTGGSATFFETGANFYAENLTIQNTYDLVNNQDVANSQALALSTTGDRAVYNNIRLIGRQDTLYAAEPCQSATSCNVARQYFFNTYIEGNVDYIFGNSEAVFDHCTIHTVYHDGPTGEATITAQDKGYAGQPSGYVFVRSLFTSESDAGAMTELFLGRPYGALSSVALSENNLQASINGAGWIEFVPGQTNRLPTAQYSEYESFGPGATGPREQYATVPTPAQAAQYEPAVFLAGTDGWNPTNALTITANQTIAYTSVVTAQGNAGVPTGTVTVSVDGSATTPVTLLNQGGTYVVSGLTAGPHTITSTYSGDATYATATSTPITITVGALQSQQTTQTVLTATASQIAPGTSDLLTATVTSSVAGSIPTGVVTFMSGTTSLGTAQLVNGAATLSSPISSVVGAYSITAIYTGEAQFLGSTSTALAVSVQQIATSLGILSDSIAPNSLTVDVNGTGNYTTVEAAVSALPSTGGTIYIKPGTYTEVVKVTQPNVSIIGLGTDPSQVVITYDNAHGTIGPNGNMLGTAGSATFTETGTNFYASNLTFQNTYDITNNQDLPNSQAVALAAEGDRGVFFNIRAIGRQDTLYASEGCSTGSTSCTATRQYFYKSYIEGNVDYVFGDSQAVFDHCTFNTDYHTNTVDETTIFAQRKQYATQPSGYVVTNSTLEAQSNLGPQTSYYLGRPWGQYSSVVLINNILTGVPVPAGWVEFSPGVTNNLPTSYFAEYGSTGPGANGPREQYAINLTAAQTAAYTPTVYLAGTDGWNPTTVTAVPAGANVVYTINVTPANNIGVPTGTVIFSVDGVALAPTTVVNGAASQTLTGLAVGPHTITFSYSGDTSFLASTGTQSIFVGTVTGQASTTVLTSSAPAAAGGTPLTLTATVTGSTANLPPSGTVTFNAGTTSLGVAPVSALGVATLSIAIPVGAQSVTAVYSGDTHYLTSTSAPVALQIGVTSTTLVASPTQAAYGAPVVLTATAVSVGDTATPVGSVTFQSGTTSLGQASLNAAGVATLTVSTLPAGTDSITASFSGGLDFVASTSTPFPVTVTAAATTTLLTASSTSAIASVPVTFTATVATTGSTTVPTGAVTFSLAGTPLGTVTLNTAGVATLTTSTLPTGNDVVIATFVPTGSTATGSASAGVPVVVSAIVTTTSLTASASQATPGTSVKLTATVSAQTGVSTPTGLVNFTSNGTALGSATLVNGVASLSTTTLPVGTDSIVATYAGVGQYPASTSTPFPVTVTAAATTTLLTASSTSAIASVPVTFTATVATTGSTTVPTGAVTFSLAGTPLGTVTLNTAGVATLTTSTLPTGNDVVIATFVPTGSTATGSTSAGVPVVVSAIVTTTSLTASASQATPGTSVKLTATVSAQTGVSTPTGLVNFTSNGTALGSATLVNGVASLSTTTLPVGTDSIVATYAGVGQYPASTSTPFPVTVTAAATTTLLTASSTSAIASVPVTFTATVATTGSTTVPTGAVTFSLAGTPLGTVTLNTAGVATLTTSTLPTGNDVVIATFVPTGSTATGSTSAGVPVVVSAIVTTTSLTASASQATPGTSVKLTATVSAQTGVSTPTGLVNFTSNGTALGSATLVNGVASLSTTTLPVGTDSIVATYAGVGQYPASTSTPFPVTVTAAATTTLLTASSTQVSPGSAVTLMATVASQAGSSTPTGTVTFSSNGLPIGSAALSKGVATLTTTQLPAGSDSIQANFAQQGSFGASASAIVTVTVTKASTITTLNASSTKVTPGGSISFTAKVADVSSSNLPTGTVTFLADGVNIGTVTLNSGLATLTIPQIPANQPPTNTVVATYNGDANSLASTSSPLTVTVGYIATTTHLASNSAHPHAGESVSLTATVNGASGIPTGTVIFTANGVVIGSAVLHSHEATLTTSQLAAGSDNIVASFAQQGNYAASTSNTLVEQVSKAATTTSLKASATTVAPGGSITFTADVRDNNSGSPAPTGTVTFLADGVNIGTATLNSGVATLTIPQVPANQPPSNTVVATYSGDANSLASTSAVVKVTVGYIATTTHLASNSAHPHAGESVSLTATVNGASGIPTGTVIFTANGVAIGSAVLHSHEATLTTSQLAAGSDNIVASFAQQGSYAASTSNTLVEQVSKAATTTSLKASATTVAPGGSITFTADVRDNNSGSPAPTGTVTFLADGVNIGTATLSSGVATLTIPQVPADQPPSNTVVATYSGDANSLASTSAPLTVTVTSSPTLGPVN